MQIHELNTKALTDPAYVAFDDGTDTYKADFKEVIDDAVAEAFSSADVSGGVVNYTSGDSSSPSSWADVPVMASGSTLATLMNRISTMIKNVRYIWSKIGTTDISGIGGGTLTGAVSAINDGVTNLFKVVSYSGSYTCSANGAVNITGNMISNTGYPSGYRAVAVVTYSTNDNNIFPRSMNAAAYGTGSMAVLTSKSSSSVTATFSINILYVKSAYVS